MQEQEQKTTVDNLGEAISVLVQATNLAQAKGGVYSFADAAKINSALEFITLVSEQKTERNEVITTEVDATVEK